MSEVPFAAHGYGSYFALSLLDRCVAILTILGNHGKILSNCRMAFLKKRYHNPAASVEEGLETLKRCIDEVAKRLIVSPGKYKVRIVDKDGTREVEL